MDKVLDTCVKRGFCEHLVICIGYGHAFDCRIPDDLLPYSTERRFIRPVSRQHNLEVLCPIAEIGRTVVGHLGPETGTELQTIFVYSDLIGPQLVSYMPARFSNMVDKPSP